MINMTKYARMHPMTFELANYADNGSLYVGLITHEEGYPEPWSNLTVNLRDSARCKSNCAYIDVNNNGDEIIDWLVRNGFGDVTEKLAISSFCIYPEFEFNMEVLMEHVSNDQRFMM